MSHHDRCHTKISINIEIVILQVAIKGKNLHAPLVERLIDLPMDITGGRINGELTLRAHNPQTWHFPSFGGRIR